MDRDDKRRYFIVGSVILEVVTPLFRQRLENQYRSQGLGSIQAFLNQQPVIHILFHLRYKNVWCCTDKSNCVNPLSLPLTYSQWDLLYTENPGPGCHLCHCKYTANAVLLNQLDITLSGLLLLNCFSLGPVEENAIRTLRQYKNNYLSHNTKGSITLAEYNTLWADLKTYVLQLDHSKEDDFVRIENRPLDEALCYKYFTCLLDIHQKLDEVNSSIQTMSANTQSLIQGLHNSMETNDATTQSLIQGLKTSVQALDANNQGYIQSLDKTLQELINYAKKGTICQHCGRNQYKGYQSRPYTLGEDILQLHHQIDLKSVLNGVIGGGVMMDDGRLVVCLSYLRILLICNTDGTEVDSIQFQDRPWDVTAVNNSTVAVILPWSNCIEMYDMHNKHKLKSIPVPVPGWCFSITTINNKLVVGCCEDKRLLMIDHQTGKVIQAIHTDCRPFMVHAAGDRIFFGDYYNTLYCYSYTDDKVTTTTLLSKLYSITTLNWYRYTDDKVTTTTLPSPPFRITSLQDGSLYVRCLNGSVQHVSSDGQHCKPVKTQGLKSLEVSTVLSYNPNQRQLMTCDIYTKVIQVFKEKVPNSITSLQ